MNARTMLPLVALGTLLGAGVHWLKSEADSANRIIQDLPQQGYDACKELNALIIAAGKDEELRDCEREFLK